MRIVLFNAPPRSGKDTLAKSIKKALDYNDRKTLIIGFAHALKNVSHAIIGRPNLPIDFYEELKDTPIEDFGGIIDDREKVSPREFYIYVSEKVMKPAFGQDVWVQIFAKAVKAAAKEFVLVPDLGFPNEVTKTVELLKPSKTIVVQIEREGCNFSKDSRSWVNVENSNIETVTFKNTGNLGDIDEFGERFFSTYLMPR